MGEDDGRCGEPHNRAVVLISPRELDGVWLLVRVADLAGGVRYEYRDE